MLLRKYDDRYAQLALGFADKLRKRVGRFGLAPALWSLADYLEGQDNGRHEQHLLMLASRWVKECASS